MGFYVLKSVLCKGEKASLFRTKQRSAFCTELAVCSIAKSRIVVDTEVQQAIPNCLSGIRLKSGNLFPCEVRMQQFFALFFLAGDVMKLISRRGDFSRNQKTRKGK